MVKIEIEYPIDNTFFSSLLFEGLLYTISNSKSDCNFNINEIEFKDKNFISDIYSNLDDNRINDLRLRMVGNDNINRTIFEKFGLNITSKKIYSDLINVLKKESKNFIIDRDSIVISLNLRKNEVLIDVKNKQEGVQAAIFKTERYMGITSTEMSLTNKQLTQYFSKEVALILLLGLYSSFITTIILQEKPYYFFLVFSPEEIIQLLSKSNKELIKKFFEIKSEMMQELKSIISKNSSNELILIELILNLKLQKLLKDSNIEKISFTLFKLALEGQIYKIYEQIPLTILSENPFKKIISKISKKTDDLIYNLYWLFSSPKSPVLTGLADNNYIAYSNLMRALYGIYRFVIVGDAQGWFDFIRELYNAYEKEKDENRKRQFLEIIRKIEVLI
ncbi:MAG: hypothetical protein LM593_06625 [Candidatus Verstraetearchaeota archaeon]|jgi:hypothetical protein|nr:hypothetical protein [Candidatus Verstraetearchaeota archaeon]